MAALYATLNTVGVRHMKPGEYGEIPHNRPDFIKNIWSGGEVPHKKPHEHGEVLHSRQYWLDRKIIWENDTTTVN